MEIKLLSYIPAILGMLLIGLLVIYNDPNNLRNRIFSAFNFLGCLWLGSLFLADSATNPSVALWSLRLALFFGGMTFLFLYYFSLIFLTKSNFSTRLLIVTSLPMIILSLLSLTSLGVYEVELSAYGANPTGAGVLYVLSDVVSLVYVITAVGILLHKYKLVNDKQKSQIRYILWGLSIAVLGNIFSNILAPAFNFETQFIWVGSFSLFVMSLFITYAIVVHGFFDVRLVVARTVAYALTIASTISIFSLALIFVISRLDSGAGLSLRGQILYVIFAVALSFIFQPLRRFFDKVTNSIFYRDAYDSAELLAEVNRVIVNDVDVDVLLQHVGDVIFKDIKPSYVAFDVRETAYVDRRSVIKGDYRYNSAAVENIESQISDYPERLIEIRQTEETNSEIYSNMSEQGISVIAKLSPLPNAEAVGYGLLLLGPKKSGNQYTKQDLNIIRIIAGELSIAVQNALRYEEIEKFNITLQEKVDDATKRLKRTNDKLKAMDETKDEFISMASHQLRTPLTSVKGYVSMVLEGDAGDLNDMQRKLLEQAFTSSQRMVFLIADLLNLSRLRTGKFVIEPKPTNLAEVIQGEVEQLKETAAGRSLSLEYHKPESFPTLMLDETKIRQVIMNFVDNAIYYTPAGGAIDIWLKETPKTIEFTVKDNGIGVPKHEQPHLFIKFYRAKNAQKARPDGTGLGLFMAKKVIVAQGGAIIFKSTENKGSTFGFTFAKDKLLVPSTEA